MAINTTPNHTPKFYVSNIASLISKKGRNQKIPFLREQCDIEKPYFLAFSETHLRNDIKEAEFNIPLYSHETSNRINREGGGVILYINNNLTYKTLISISDEMCSMVAVHINEINLIVFVVYRPPPNYKTGHYGETLEKSFRSTVIENINNVIIQYKAPVPDIILAGDFNFPKATWTHGIGEAFANTKHEKNSLQQLINVASNLNLLQKVTFGTRETSSGNNNILDLVFTNNHELISNIFSEKSKLSDHKSIICETSHNAKINHQQIGIPTETNLASYNYLKTNWVTLKTKLQEIDWSEVLSKYKSAAEKLQVFLDIVIKVVDEHSVKFKQQRGVGIKKIPRDRRKLLRNKKKLRKKLKKESISKDKKDRLENAIANIDIELLDSHQRERYNEEAKAIDNMKTNPKYFFTHARKHLKTKSTIGPFKIDEELTTLPNEISEKLSNQYSSSFSQPDLSKSIGNPKEFFNVSENPNIVQLTDIDFTEDMIVTEIFNIKRDSAPGPDHFPVMLLQKCAEEFSKPLHLIWRHSLDAGEIAPLLKQAVICPILKANSQRCLPKSYRPVSLTSHLIKVFERVMRASIVKYLVDNDLLPKNQHGFISGRSTLSQLLHQIEHLIRAWEEGRSTDTIYLDFAKAFDKVDHNILCQKIRRLGITGKVGRWIREFLTGRYQQVSANGALSDPAPVISGVPQGTVLGPILFIIMIDDLDCELIHSVASKYADDTRVTAIISKPDDAANFQTELQNKIYPWGPANNMLLNGEKFEHLHVGKNLDQLKSSYLDPAGNIIEEKEQIKDLGVIISNDLTWSKQIKEVVSKARIMTGWVLRTFATRDRDPMVTMWNTQVRSTLDYCSPLWSPDPKDLGNIDLLENTQRSFTRSINGMEGLDYTQRLRKLHMYSVQRRHERYKIIYIYKIKEGLVPNVSDTHGLQFHPNERHGCVCKVPKFPLYNNKAVKARNRSFALTASQLWNSLPKFIRDITGVSVDSFKRKLDSILKHCPDEPRCSATGVYMNSQGRTSNSLYDICNNREVKRRVKQMNLQHGGLPRWPGSK